MLLVKSAVCRDGVIVTGKRHCDAIRNAVEQGWKIPIMQSEQGFVDEEGNYYSRKEAMAVAIKSGMMDESSIDKTLYSEDLW